MEDVHHGRANLTWNDENAQETTLAVPHRDLVLDRFGCCHIFSWPQLERHFGATLASEAREFCRFRFNSSTVSGDPSDGTGASRNRFWTANRDFIRLRPTAILVLHRHQPIASRPI